MPNKNFNEALASVLDKSHLSMRDRETISGYIKTLRNIKLELRDPKKVSPKIREDSLVQDIEDSLNDCIALLAILSNGVSVQFSTNRHNQKPKIIKVENDISEELEALTAS